MPRGTLVMAQRCWLIGELTGKLRLRGGLILG